MCPSCSARPLTAQLSLAQIQDEFVLSHEERLTLNVLEYHPRESRTLSYAVDSLSRPSAIDVALVQDVNSWYALCTRLQRAGGFLTIRVISDTMVSTLR